MTNRGKTIISCTLYIYMIFYVLGFTYQTLNTFTVNNNVNFEMNNFWYIISFTIFIIIEAILFLYKFITHTNFD